MGTDMTMLFERRNCFGKWQPICHDVYLDRDYNMFYILIGKIGYGDPSFPPISTAKGFPKDMSRKWLKDWRLNDRITYFMKELPDYVSFVTLKELLDSPFSVKQNFKGWTYEDWYENWLKGKIEHLQADPINTPDFERDGMVLKDFYEYINITLIERVIIPMQKLKKDNKIHSDDDIRMIFMLG